MLHLVDSDATYLLWIDCGKVTNNSIELTDFIRKQTGLFLSNGSQYGDSGKKFIRMNIACPKEILIDGLNRFKLGITSYEKRR